MHGCALAGTGVCNFAWQCIHSGIDCPISGGRGSRTPGRHRRRSRQWQQQQFQGYNEHWEQSLPTWSLSTVSWTCDRPNTTGFDSSCGGRLLMLPLLRRRWSKTWLNSTETNRQPFVLGFIQDRMFRFTCKMECTQYHNEGFTATLLFLAPACPLAKRRNQMAL